MQIRASCHDPVGLLHAAHAMLCTLGPSHVELKPCCRCQHMTCGHTGGQLTCA